MAEKPKWKDPPTYGASPSREYWNVSDMEAWWNNALYVQELLYSLAKIRVELTPIDLPTFATIP